MRLKNILTPRLQIFNNIKDSIFYICCRESKEMTGKVWHCYYDGLYGKIETTMCGMKSKLPQDK
jgi:hypothetical protein